MSDIKAKKYIQNISFSNINIHKGYWMKINEKLNSVNRDEELSNLNVKDSWNLIQEKAGKFCMPVARVNKSK